MGSGIAQVSFALIKYDYNVNFIIRIKTNNQVAAQTGHNVTLVEVNADVLAKAQTSIKNNLSRVAKKLYKDDKEASEKFISESLEKLKGSTDVKAAVSNADLVVEAIVENIEIKHKLFAEVDKVNLVFVTLYYT